MKDTSVAISATSAGNLKNCAAQYVRMSGEHQRYSIEHQVAALADYAQVHGLDVVETYADPGRSGLTLARRPGLRQLLQDVLGGTVGFGVLLIYDVSRWGRFQDVDESAHYEFLLRRAGLKVIYCAEPFDNDGSPLSSIVKGLKRVMAGETSREMSVKIRAARRQGAQRGFWLGAQVGVGLRRVCVDGDGVIKGPLMEYQRKYLQSDHVILVPGPEEEVAAVQRAFEMFGRGGASMGEIAAWLAEQGIRRPYDRTWNSASVRRMFANEAYVGTLVTQKFECALGAEARPRLRSDWCRTPNAFEPIVDRSLFDLVARRVRRSGRHRPDDELLDDLRDLLNRKGRLSFNLVNSDELTTSPSVYNRRFGSLTDAYARIGYAPARSNTWIKLRQDRAGWRTYLRQEIVRHCEAAGMQIRAVKRGRLLANESVLISPSVLGRTKGSGRGGGTWYLQNRSTEAPDVRVALRLAADDSAPLDFLIIPSGALIFKRASLGARPGEPFARHVYPNLSPLAEILIAAS